MAKDDTPSTRPLIDKLGVKPGDRVAVLGIDDTEFWRVLRGRTGDIRTTLRTACNVVFYEADSERDLARLPALRKKIVENGAIWVVSRKGKAATIKDIHVIGAAKSAGLVDNKVVSFSPTHTSLRLVVPLALRKAP